MNIYQISAKYIALANEMGKSSRENTINDTLKRELSDLSHQCNQASERIVRDFTDEGIALDNLLILLQKFNDIALGE